MAFVFLPRQCVFRRVRTASWIYKSYMLDKGRNYKKVLFGNYPSFPSNQNSCLASTFS